MLSTNLKRLNPITTTTTSTSLQKTLELDGDIANDGFTVTFNAPTLTSDRVITIPDANITLGSGGGSGGVSNANDLTGTSLNSSIINSNIKTLGIQGSSLDMGLNKITNLLTPELTNDAVNKSYVDTISSSIISNSSSLNNAITSSNIQRLGTQMETLNMNNNYISGLRNASYNGDATNKYYVDNQIQTVVGSICTGTSLTSSVVNSSLKNLGTQDEDLDMGTLYKIVNLATPSLSTDGANKSYVDSSISNVASSSNTLNPSIINSSLKNLGVQNEDLDMGTLYKITNLATPSLSTDASTKGYVDSSLSTVASSNTLNSSVINSSLKNLGTQNEDLDMGTLYKITNLATPTLSTDASTKGYVDSSLSTVASSNTLSSTITSSSLQSLGTQSQNLNMGGLKITNIGIPSNTNDACTKKYADDLKTSILSDSATLDFSITNSSLKNFGALNANLNINSNSVINLNKIITPDINSNIVFGKNSILNALSQVSSNVHIGSASFRYLDGGVWNTCVGNSSGYNTYYDSSYNTILGGQAFFNTYTLNNNVAIGYNCAFTNAIVEGECKNNTFIGGYSLVDNINPFNGIINCVTLGFGSGSGLTPSSYDLIIGSGDVNNQLIHGSFASGARHFSPAVSEKIDLGKSNKKWNNVNSKRINSDKINVKKYRYNYNLPNLWAIYDFSDERKLGYDYSGNYNDIVIGGPLYQKTYTSINSVVYFNQTTDNGNYNQRIDLSNILSSLKKNSNITISFWINVLDTTAKELICISNGSVDTTNIRVYFSALNTIAVDVKNNSTSVYSNTANVSLTASTWYHLALSFSGSGLSLYLNGTSILTTTTAISWTTYTLDTFLIGCKKISNTYSSPLTSTYMHTLSIWNKTLSSTEIGYLYNNEYGSEVIPLFGQSNMCGRGTLVAGTDSLTNTRVNQYPFSVNVDASGNATGTTISTASNPLDHQGTDATSTMGLWYAFCIAILPYIPLRRKILLVPTALSGAGFSTGDFIRTAIPYIGMKNAINKAVSLHPWNRLNCYLMHQGESEAGNNFKYYNYLNEFYQNLVSDISFNSSLPYIYGNIKESSTDKALVNQVLKAFEDEDAGRYMVDCTNFETSDGTHFLNQPLREIGKNYAFKWIKHYAGNSIDSQLLASNQVTYINNDILAFGDMKQSIWNSSAINFNGNTPVYLNVSVTLDPGLWLIYYNANVIAPTGTATICFLSTSSVTTSALAVGNRVDNTIQNIKCPNVTSGSVGGNVTNVLFKQITSTTTFYLYGMSSTSATTSATAMFNVAISGSVDDPDATIFLSALYIKP